MACYRVNFTFQNSDDKAQVPLLRTPDIRRHCMKFSRPVYLAPGICARHRRCWVSNELGRAMAQAVSHRSLTAQARIRSRLSPCGICGGQSGTGTGFSPSTSVFPCQFHSTGAPLLGKTKKSIIVITGLHNKPQGCDASVASAAGPFSTKKPDYCQNSLFLSLTSVYVLTVGVEVIVARDHTQWHTRAR
jgi:hypothetical protein